LWLRLVGGNLYLAFLEGGLPMGPLLSPERALAWWEARLKREVEVLEGLLRALGELHLEAGDREEDLT
jgi:hypothetical protein